MWRHSGTSCGSISGARALPQVRRTRDVGDLVLTPRPVALALAAAASAGAVLRIWHWLYARSFWLDEARLALNVAGRTYADLTGPLWYDQAAPPLFLWASKLVASLAGVSDIALRAIPLAAGLVLAPFVFAGARRMVSPRAAMLAAAFAALSPWAVYYANEFKPYSTDMLAAATLLLLTMSVQKVPSRGNLAAMATVGALAPWFSFGAYFILPPSWLAIAWRSAGRARRSVLLTGGLWAASLGAAYLLVYSRATTNAYLHEFWSYRMLTFGPEFGPRLWSALEDLFVGTYLGFLQVPGDSASTAIMAALAGGGLAGFGALRILRRNRAAGIALIGPLILAMAAAFVGRFPLALRVTMFVAPALYITLAESIDHLAAMAERAGGRRVFPALAAIVLVIPVLVSLQHAARPERWGPVKAVVRQLLLTAQPGETIYVSAGSMPVWAFYSTDWDHPDRRRLEAFAEAASSAGYAFENRAGYPGDAALEPDPEHDLGVRQLWGRPTGMQWTPRNGYYPRTPDPRWAADEAARIARAGSSTVWVLTSHLFGGAQAALRSAITACGGNAVSELGRGNVGLTAFEFAAADENRDC